jgi:hypothetical protein
MYSKHLRPNNRVPNTSSMYRTNCPIFSTIVYISNRNPGESADLHSKSKPSNQRSGESSAAGLPTHISEFSSLFSHGCIVNHSQKCVSELRLVNHRGTGLVTVYAYSQVFHFTRIVVRIIPLRENNLWNSSPFRVKVSSILW